MSESLGRLEDLPAEYVAGLESRNTLPLWPALRNLLPFRTPTRRTRPTLWRYAEIRPDLLRAGDLTPIEKAERRVIVLCNPGLGLTSLMATPSIYIGLQLILPGETAPNHRHSPSAVRFVIEGGGGFTVVDGEKLSMEKGDLILTPAGLWHEHGHAGTGPVIWLDALDLPLIHFLEASYCLGADAQPCERPDGVGTARAGTAGVLPYDALDRPAEPYPLRRFPWRGVKAALGELSRITAPGRPVHLAYVNPETGRECLPTLGFSALMLRAGEEIALPRRSCSGVLHVVEGEAGVLVDSQPHTMSESDTVAVPTHASVRLANGSARNPAYLFVVDDAPLHRRLGIYEVFAERGP